MLVFLDIDGVMVPAKSWAKPEFLADGFPAFAPKAVAALKRLLEGTRGTVVLTTSHKSTYTAGQWKAIFGRRGIDVSSLNTLETNTRNLSRKDEVLNWFNLNSTDEDFVIIDDDKSLNDLPPFLKNNLVLTSSFVGLTEECLQGVWDKQPELV